MQNDDDLSFGEEVDSSEEREIRNESKSEALKDQSKSEESQTLGIAEQTTNEQISINEKSDPSTVLPFHTHSRIIQKKTDGLVEQLRLQNAHYQTIIGGEVHISGEDVKENGILSGAGIEGIYANKRRKQLNGELDQKNAQSTPGREEMHSTNETIRSSIASILKTDADKQKFEKMAQIACTDLKTTIEKSGNHKVKESIAIACAKKELEKQILKFETRSSGLKRWTQSLCLCASQSPQCV